MSSDTKINLVASAESSHLILKNVSVLSELSSQLKRETKKGENSLESLQSLLFQAGKNVSSLHKCVETLLTIAKKLVYQSLKIVPVADPNFQSLKTEADKLLNILDEIQNDEDEQSLDAKWRQIDKSLKMNSSSKSINICEKYPEHCSKESLLDISSISTLPTLHEDVFVNFHKPNKTSSSCSLKNLRRIKKCMQKITNDDYELENETEKADATPSQSPDKTVGVPPTRFVSQ
ncbi:uncharacterized protein LOC124367404 isoform X2 [Homalodisca vitripennis]|uniref:uncharacterized protein LOC124367404 isoform X2 n=1 Tax=Homalodisca vitripennis TaxID=197043 RepID=UPI001EEB5AEF|nr:uncharacterized protein LOC124367404 isoform X2 [Homalodisca vitripennis]